MPDFRATAWGTYGSFQRAGAPYALGPAQIAAHCAPGYVPSPLSYGPRCLPLPPAAGPGTMSCPPGLHKVLLPSGEYACAPGMMYPGDPVFGLEGTPPPKKPADWCPPGWHYDAYIEQCVLNGSPKVGANGAEHMDLPKLFPGYPYAKSVSPWIGPFGGGTYSPPTWRLKNDTTNEYARSSAGVNPSGYPVATLLGGVGWWMRQRVYTYPPPSSITGPGPWKLVCSAAPNARVWHCLYRGTVYPPVQPYAQTFFSQKVGAMYYGGSVRAPGSYPAAYRRPYTSPQTYTVTLGTLMGNTILATKQFASAGPAHTYANQLLASPPPSSDAYLSAFMTEPQGGQYLEMTTLGYWTANQQPPGPYAPPIAPWSGHGPHPTYPWSS